MHFPELTYARPEDTWIKRVLIRLIEKLSDRDHFAPLYARWKNEIVPAGGAVMRPMFDLLKTPLVIDAPSWPPPLDADRPVVIIANHPFGILDGIGALTIAEDLGRPFKVLINKDLLKVPEIQRYALPIDFDETIAAQRTNLVTRKEALRHLAEGTTIVVFPAGGISTAATPFGQAVDLPWKGFVARLIQTAKASVLPVYFEGQCSPLFHFVSRYSLTLRLSLLIREFRWGVGRPVVAHVGPVVRFEELAHGDDRKALVGELFDRVHALSGKPVPSQDDLPGWLLGRPKLARGARAEPLPAEAI